LSKQTSRERVRAFAAPPTLCEDLSGTCSRPRKGGAGLKVTQRTKGLHSHRAQNRPLRRWAARQRPGYTRPPVPPSPRGPVHAFASAHPLKRRLPGWTHPQGFPFLSRVRSPGDARRHDGSPACPRPWPASPLRPPVRPAPSPLARLGPTRPKGRAGAGCPGLKRAAWPLPWRPGQTGGNRAR
jgi:hypothetical protein